MTICAPTHPVGLHRACELELPASVVTIGAFDGVHRGHQAVIEETVAASRALELPAVVYTFDPPPKVFFGTAAALTSIRDKIARIRHFTPDHIVVATFDRSYSRRPAAMFLHELTVMNPALIYVGSDFRFGSCKTGDVALLARHFPVRVVEPVCCSGGHVVSSTRIRQLRTTGATLAAEALEGWRDRSIPHPHWGVVA